MDPSTALVSVALQLALIVDHRHQPESMRAMTYVARVVASLDAQLSQLWPGFWPPGQPFAFYGFGGCVLRSGEAPGAGFFPILGTPGFWRGACAGGPFRGPIVVHEEIGGIVAPAVAVRHPDEGRLERAAPLLLHEAFHAFQDERFRSTGFAGSDFSFAREAELVGMKLRENRRLLAAALSDDRGRQVALVHAALAMRQTRLARMPEEAEAIEDWWLVREGTAQYVGRRVEALIRGRGEESPRALRDGLRRRTSGHGGAWERLLRWRSYQVGAAVGVLLDRWQVDWKGRVATGEPLLAILAEASGYDPADRATLLEAAAGDDEEALEREAQELLEEDRAADRALERYAAAKAFALALEPEDDYRESFSASEFYSLPDGILVVDPTRYSGRSADFELTVWRLPVRVWETDPPSEERVEVALPEAPLIEGCSAAAGRCGAGTRIHGPGVELVLHRELAVTASPGRLELRPPP